MTMAGGTISVGSNLITGGDSGEFTTNSNGWTGLDADLGTIPGGVSGDCLKITSTGGLTQYAESPSFPLPALSLTTGKHYRVTAWVKSGTSGDDAFIIQLYAKTSAIEIGSISGISSNVWTQYTFDCIYTSGIEPVLRLIKNTSHVASPGTMLFDSVSLCELTYTGPIRIYPLKAPQNPTYPFIVYQRISTNPDYTLGGFANLSNVTIQIDCYATDHAGIRTLSSALHTAMQSAPFKNILENDMDFNEPDLEGYRVTQDYSIWINE